MARQRLSNIDTLMLRVEDPAQPNIGTAVMVLGAPVDFERLQATIRARLLQFDRFRQRLVRPRLPGAGCHWQDDLDFDLAYHLQKAILPPPGDQAALQETVSLLAGTPLDLARPLWQMHLVKAYGQGSALICRVHHSLGDGVALMHVLLALADPDPADPSRRIEPKPMLDLPDPPRRTAAHARRRAARRMVRTGLEALSHLPPRAELAQLGEGAVMDLGDMLLSPPDSDTALRGAISLPKRAAWSAPVPLTEIKTIGRQEGGTVNDVLLAALTGALRRYLQSHGESVTGVRLRALVPISLRSPGTEAELGNRIGIVLLPLPVDIDGPTARLREIKRRMDGHKGSLEAPIVFAAMRAFGSAPAGPINAAVDYLCARATAVLTNVKGPQQRLYLAGAPLEAFMIWTPRFGGIGVGASIISYAGEVRLGIITDEATVPDPEAIITGFHDEYNALLALALQRQRSPIGEERPAPAADALATREEIPNEGAGKHQPASQATPARCQALTKAGRPCKNHPLPGSGTCFVHQ